MATTQNFNYPSSSDVTVTGIGSPVGQPFPGSAVPIAGDNPSGNLTPIQTDANGNLIVVPAAGTTGDVNLTEVGGAAISEGQKTSANSLPVVIASDQSALPITAASLPLPTDAATAANQVTQEATLTSILANQTNGTQEVQVTNFPATQPVSGTVTANQGTTPWVQNLSQFGGSAVSLGSKVSASSIPIVIASDQAVLPLPTGAATSALQSSTQGSASGGTAATASTLAGTVFTTVPPTLTNGQQTALRSDINGELIIAPLNSASIVTAIIESNHGLLTDNSGATSATPGSSTTIMISNTGRRYLLIENVSTTATIWVNFTSAATTGSGSYALLPGGSLVQETGFVSTEQVNVASTVASVPYTAKQA